jgi:hypothetical protein
MGTIRPTTVEVETQLRLVAPDATALPVRARHYYDPADPYVPRGRESEHLDVDACINRLLAGR